MSNFKNPYSQPDPAVKLSEDDKTIRVFGIVKESIVDGPGMRFVIFVQGCSHSCRGCHNPNSHDIVGGKPAQLSKIWEEIVENPLINGITFSGGEPFIWASELSQIGEAARQIGLDVMTYTGYTYTDLLTMAKADAGIKSLLSVSNYLVDGRYIEEERDLTLKFRGSRNQKIYDITCYPNSDEASEVNFDEKSSPSQKYKAVMDYVHNNR